MFLEEFEKQVLKIEQIVDKPLVTRLMDAVLSEDALRNLEIKPNKKYLGPIGEGTMGEIYGPRGIGKTFLRDAISLCLTRNLDLGPLKCENPASVLIVDGEMSLHLLKERQSLSQNLGKPLKPLDIIANEQIYQAGSPVINLIDITWRDAFIELIKTMDDRWDVIIFDNLSSFLPGVKENDSEAWGPINGFFLQLRWLGKAVIFVHHAGKSGDQRGTSCREDQLDFVLKLTPAARHNPEAGCRFDATFTKARSLVGAEAAPFTFAISDHPKGGLMWSVTNQRESRKETIIALLGNGISQKSISEILDVDKGYVSRTKTAAIEKKLLNDSGAGFTAQGMLKYGDVNIDEFTGCPRGS